MTITNIPKLGIIAGGGGLPELLVQTCSNNGIKPYVVGFANSTNEKLLSSDDALLAKFGQVGKIIKFFQH